MGELDLNIATFHLGRKEEGSEAIALIEVDGQITDVVLDRLQTLPQVVRADYLHFAV